MPDNLTPYEELGPTRRLTQSAQHGAPLPSVIPEVLEAIGEMFARFPPTSQADLESRALRIKLMAEDLHDVRFEHINRAARELARETPYLPKAFDIVEKAKGYLDAEWREWRAREPVIAALAPEPQPTQEQLTRAAARAILQEEGIGPGHFLWKFAGGDA